MRILRKLFAYKSDKEEGFELSSFTFVEWCFLALVTMIAFAITHARAPEGSPLSLIISLF